MEVKEEKGYDKCVLRWWEVLAEQRSNVTQSVICNCIFSWGGIMKGITVRIYHNYIIVTDQLTAMPHYMLYRWKLYTLLMLSCYHHWKSLHNVCSFLSSYSCLHMRKQQSEHRGCIHDMRDNEMKTTRNVRDRSDNSWRAQIFDIVLNLLWAGTQ